MKKTKDLLRVGAALSLVAALVLQVVPGYKVFAAGPDQITNRNLTLEAGTTDGGSKPGGTVKHLFNFTLNDGTDQLGSIVFQYCTTAAPVPGGTGCIAPTGISTQNATLGTQSGANGFTGITNSSKDDATDGVYNVITLKRTTAATITAPLAVSYEIDSVVNPSTPQTFFVRISTYTALDGSGSALEAGTVAAATSTQISLSGTMPESLVFCAGATVGLTAGVPDCSTVTTGAVSFDKLFSPTDTATASSQMAASTNAGQGYAITVNGPTLTSGSNTIAAMATTDTSKHGVSQFGMNLVANTTASSNPAVGTAIAPASNGTNYNGQPKPTSGYDVADSFHFATGDTVANSNAKGTDAQIYTASYIVNVPGSQPAGTYTSTLTYICTPTF